mgnify:FL=1
MVGETSVAVLLVVDMPDSATEAGGEARRGGTSRVWTRESESRAWIAMVGERVANEDGGPPGVSGRAGRRETI